MKKAKKKNSNHRSVGNDDRGRVNDAKVETKQ